MLDKKALERKQLDALLRAVTDAPFVQAFEESETPDFLLTTPNGRLGVEITRFFLPPPEGERPHQERQALKNQIVLQAQEMHRDEGGPALDVFIYFDPDKRLSKGQVVPIAKSIAECLLASSVPGSIQEPELSVPWRELPEKILDIDIYGIVDGNCVPWVADAGGWGAGISSGHLVQVIERKTKALICSRKVCDELWFVIVNDAFSNAAPAKISDAAREATYACPCDRLIWLLPHVPKAIDLNLQ